MKKINYLLPLLVVPLLFACGKKGATYQVTKEEFYKALYLEGVDHLQIWEGKVDESTFAPEIGHNEYIYAPNAFDWTGYDENESVDFHYRAFKNNTEPVTYDKYRCSATTPWEVFEKGSTSDSYYEEISEVAEELHQVEEMGYSYEDYQYDESKKGYCLAISEENKKSNIIVYFKNKKLIAIDTDADAEKISAFMRRTYAYEQKDIVVPIN